MNEEVVDESKTSCGFTRHVHTWGVTYSYRSYWGTYNTMFSAFSMNSGFALLGVNLIVGIFAVNCICSIASLVSLLT